MRILFLQDHLRLGGTEKQTLSMAQYCANQGHPTLLVVFRPGGIQTPCSSTPFEVKTLQPLNTRIDEWAPGLKKAVRQFQPDRIVFMGTVSHLYYRKIARNFPDIKLIATYRNGVPPLFYYQKALNLAPLIITNSRFAKTRVLDWIGGEESRVKVIHNACVLKNAELLAKTSSPASELKLLTVAMFRPEKNQQELIKILASLPKELKWTSTFLGDGKTRKHCEDLAKQLGISERIQFIQDIDPAGLYKTHDLALLTSKMESLPNFLVEAQTFGLPIIAYDVHGVAECFEETVSGYKIPFGDKVAFAEAIQLFSENRNKVYEMSSKALSYAKDHFNPKTQGQRFIEAIS